MTSKNELDELRGLILAIYDEIKATNQATDCRIANARAVGGIEGLIEGTIVGWKHRGVQSPLIDDIRARTTTPIAKAIQESPQAFADGFSETITVVRRFPDPLC